MLRLARFLSCGVISVGMVSAALPEEAAPSISLSDRQSLLFIRAQRAAAAESSLEAAGLYQELLDSVAINEKKLHEELLHRLCAARLDGGEASVVIQQLQNHPFLSESNRLCALLAVAYLQENQLHQSKTLLLDLKDEGYSPLEVHRLLLTVYYKLDAPVADLMHIVEYLKEVDQTGEVWQEGLLLLSRRYLVDGQPSRALEVLQQIRPTDSTTSAKAAEAAYLKGTAFQQLNAPIRAVPYLEQSIQLGEGYTDWKKPAKERLVACLLALVERDTTLSKVDIYKHLTSAHELLKDLQKDNTSNHLTLLQVRTTLLYAKARNDSESLERAFQVLRQPQLLDDPELRPLTYRLLAEMSPDSEERDRHWDKLLQVEGCATAENWLRRGENLLREATQFKDSGRYAEAEGYLTRAGHCFSKAHHLTNGRGPVGEQALQALLNTAVISCSDNCIKMALQVTSSEQQPTVDSLSEECLYFYSLACMQHPHYFQQEGIADPTDEALALYLTKYPRGSFSPAIVFLQARRAYEQGNYVVAEHLFGQIVSLYPQENEAGNALYWQARCQHKLQENAATFSRKMRKVYQEYPACGMAAEAYFHEFSYQEYLQGDPSAIRHLEAMPMRYPNSPFLINAYYLLGLDAKHTRYPLDGTAPRLRSWSRAIDAFQQAEQTYDSLAGRGLLPAPQVSQLTFLRYRSTLEQALANLAIASESRGAKKHVYLQYAIDRLETLLTTLELRDAPLVQKIRDDEALGTFVEETRYSQALAYARAKLFSKAEEQITQLLKHYQGTLVTRGYYLSKTYSLSADIHIQEGRYREALRSLASAEEAARGRVLSTDERLNLWLCRAQCYTDLKELDLAMKELSRVINDDAVSVLRVKAMFLRAGVYEQQGRPELARKQFVATAKQGGHWAAKAKEKLTNENGAL